MASDLRLKEQLPALTAAIVATYTKEDRINHLGHCPLPKYEVVVGILDDLKDILYPGFRRREGLHIGNVMYHVGNLIDGGFEGAIDDAAGEATDRLRDMGIDLRRNPDGSFEVGPGDRAPPPRRRREERPGPYAPDEDPSVYEQR